MGAGRKYPASFFLWTTLLLLNCNVADDQLLFSTLRQRI